MQIVQCPHCLSELANDGSLAGQAATCAACGQLFQMPALAQPVAVAAPSESAFELPRRRKQAGNAGFTAFVVFALLILPLITLIIGLGLILSGGFRGTQQERPDPSEAHPKTKARR